MKRVFIVRKDLNMSSGKLAAQIGHCAEAYWLQKIKNELFRGEDKDFADLILDKSEVDGYILGSIVKIICQAKNLNHLLKAKEIAESLGLQEGVDFGFINDACFTELTPENDDGTTTTAFWSKPLEDDIANTISKKYHLYVDINTPRTPLKSPNRSDIYICPNCKTEFGLLKYNIARQFNVHCHICGQKFDWDNFDYSDFNKENKEDL